MDLSTRITAGLALFVLAVMITLTVLAILNMRSSGSLDNLPADLIKKAVDREE